jgi:hypothetical protein
MVFLGPILIAVSGLFLWRHAAWIAANCSLGSDSSIRAARTASSAARPLADARRIGLGVVGLFAIVDALPHAHRLLRSIVHPSPSGYTGSFTEFIGLMVRPRTSLTVEAIYVAAYSVAATLLILSFGRVTAWLRRTFLMPRVARDAGDA